MARHAGSERRRVSRMEEGAWIMMEDSAWSWNALSEGGRSDKSREGRRQ